MGLRPSPAVPDLLFLAGSEAEVARIDPRNRTRYWDDPRVAGLSCLHADFTTHDYAPHAHDGFVIAVTEEGGAEFTSRGEVAEATPSVLLVFNPDEPHSGRMGRSRRWRYRSLYLAEAAIAEVAHMLGVPAVPHFTRNRVSDPDLIGAFLDLHQALDRGEDPLRQRELLAGASAGCSAVMAAARASRRRRRPRHTSPAWPR